MYKVTRSASALQWVRWGGRGVCRLDELQRLQGRLSADAWNSSDARPAAYGGLMKFSQWKRWRGVASTAKGASFSEGGSLWSFITKNEFWLAAEFRCRRVVVWGIVLVDTKYWHQRLTPVPLKCFRAPSHQILAKSAPQKARNRDKPDFATKVRESSMNNWGTFDSKSLFKGGTFDSLSQVLKFSGGTFEDFTTTKSP